MKNLLFLCLLLNLKLCLNIVCFLNTDRYPKKNELIKKIEMRKSAILRDKTKDDKSLYFFIDDKQNYPFSKAKSLVENFGT